MLTKPFKDQKTTLSSLEGCPGKCALTFNKIIESKATHSILRGKFAVFYTGDGPYQR